MTDPEPAPIRVARSSLPCRDPRGRGREDDLVEALGLDQQQVLDRAQRVEVTQARMKRRAQLAQPRARRLDAAVLILARLALGPEAHAGVDGGREHRELARSRRDAAAHHFEQVLAGDGLVRHDQDAAARGLGGGAHTVPGKREQEQALDRRADLAALFARQSRHLGFADAEGPARGLHVERALQHEQGRGAVHHVRAQRRARAHGLEHHAQLWRLLEQHPRVAVAVVLGLAAQTRRTRPARTRG